MQIGFYGAAQTVTGSKHLLSTPGGTKLLLDCGLFQGRMDNREDMNRHFGFSPHEIDYLVLSHAHIDHSGLIPRLVAEGFRGKIICTPATKSLCETMLLDSAHIQTDDLKHVNKRRLRKGLPVLQPLYDVEDVAKAMSLFHTVDYDQHLHLDEELSLLLSDAGHLLGSTVVNLQIKEAGKTTRIAFTGDIGRYNDPILRNPQPFEQCDILICESTYGNKRHPESTDSENRLLDIVRETCVENLGKLIIPAFSVDRTQEIVYLLDKAANEKRLPNIKVFVDSPLSVKATQIIRKHQECFRTEFIDYIKQDPDPFGFHNLHYISEVEESKKLNALNEPCIIISASGMAEAGRIKHHIANNIENHQNTILLVGYCTPDSLGGRLKNGDKSVRIFGEEYPVKARVENMDQYSAHADYEEIFRFLSCQNKSLIRKTFLVHGEHDTLVAFKARFEERGYQNIIIPQLGDVCEI